MAKKEKEMDQLTKDCISAQQAGMSYGQYMALKPRSETEAKVNKREGYRQCPACGKWFIAEGYGSGNKKYCDIGCRQDAISMMARGMKLFGGEADAQVD